MNLLSFSARNLSRNRIRTALTIAGMAIAVVSFVLLRTVVSAYHFAADRAAEDRLFTRHKISSVVPLPMKYMSAVRAVPGVKVAAFGTPVAMSDPRDRNTTWTGWASDPATFLAVFDEVVLPQEQMERWKADRRGAIIGDVLARKLRCKVGDEVTVTSSRFGDVSFTIDGIYRVSGKTMERTNLVFQWEYFNAMLPDQQREQVALIFTQVSDPKRASEIGSAIDRVLGERDVATLTMSERSFGLALLGGVTAILSAVDVASLVIVVLMMLIMGNTIAMGVQERTREQGALRALGFRAYHVGGLVVAESATLGLLSGLLGLTVSYLLVELFVGRWLEENVGDLVPYFRVSAPLLVGTLLLSTALGVVAGLLPAYRASKLSVIDALRQL